MYDAEQGAESSPERGGKLSTSIAGDSVWHAVMTDPAIEKGRCTVCGGDGGQRYCYRPAAGTVDNCKNISESLGGRQGPDQIDVEMGKTTERDWNGSGL
jgi:hypothetical protein